MCARYTAIKKPVIITNYGRTCQLLIPRPNPPPETFITRWLTVMPPCLSNNTTASEYNPFVTQLHWAHSYSCSTRSSKGFINWRGTWNAHWNFCTLKNAIFVHLELTRQYPLSTFCSKGQFWQIIFTFHYIWTTMSVLRLHHSHSTSCYLMHTIIPTSLWSSMHPLKLLVISKCIVRMSIHAEAWYQHASHRAVTPSKPCNENSIGISHM